MEENKLNMYRGDVFEKLVFAILFGDVIHTEFAPFNMHTELSWFNVTSFAIMLLMWPHLTLQEEKDSGFDEVGVHALSASSLGHAVIFRVSMTEQSANKDENVKPQSNTA